MQNGKEPFRPLTRMGFALNDRHSPTIYGQRIRFAGRWLIDGAKFLSPIILPCPAKRVSVSSVVHDSRTATCTPGKPPTVMKYHAEDTSMLNGPRWSSRFRVGFADHGSVSFGRAVSMRPPQNHQGRAVSLKPPRGWRGRAVSTKPPPPPSGISQSNEYGRASPETMPKTMSR